MLPSTDISSVELGEFREALSAPGLGSKARASAEKGLTSVFMLQLEAGDILLVEAFLEFADLPEATCRQSYYSCSCFHGSWLPVSAKVDRNFSFVAVVPESAPPRHGRRVDQRRGWLALLLLAIVIVCSVLPLA